MAQEGGCMERKMCTIQEMRAKGFEPQEVPLGSDCTGCAFDNPMDIDTCESVPCIVTEIGMNVLWIRKEAP